MIFVIKQITVLPALSSSPPSLSITVLLLIFFSTANQLFQLYCCVPVCFSIFMGIYGAQ